jgi:hypothetical protein
VASAEVDAAQVKFEEERMKLVMDRDMAHSQLRNVKQQLAKAQAELEMAQGAAADQPVLMIEGEGQPPES